MFSFVVFSTPPLVPIVMFTVGLLPASKCWWELFLKLISCCRQGLAGCEIERTARKVVSFRKCGAFPVYSESVLKIFSYSSVDCV